MPLTTAKVNLQQMGRQESFLTNYHMADDVKWPYLVIWHVKGENRKEICRVQSVRRITHASETLTPHIATQKTPVGLTVL
jgi:hypothetical protein